MATFKKYLRNDEVMRCALLQSQTHYCINYEISNP